MPPLMTQLMCAALCCNKKVKNSENGLSELKELPRQIPLQAPLAQERRTGQDTPGKQDTRTVSGQFTYPPSPRRQSNDVKATPVTNLMTMTDSVTARQLHETPGNYPWTAPKQVPAATCCDHYHPVTMARTQNLNNAMALRQNMLEAVRQGRTVTSPGNEDQSRGKEGLRGNEMEISAVTIPKSAKSGNVVVHGGASKG